MSFKVKLKDVALLKNGKKITKKESGRYEVFGANGPIGYSDEFLLEKESIILGRVGANCGSVHYSSKPIWISDNTIGIVPKDNVDGYYLYYILSSLRLNEMAAGSAQPLINQSIINSIDLNLINLDKQKKVGAFLQYIDEKIKTNKEIILTLEQISQTLFKHWFIDFEFPNEEGQPYKSSNGKMVESELGNIPEEWEILRLSDITTLLKKTFNPSKTDIKTVVHFSLPAFDKNKIPTLDNVSNIKSNKWILEDNCIVFSKMNPKTPRIWLTNINKHHVNIASSEFVVLKSNTAKANSFIYNLCKSEVFNEYLIANATGSTNSRQRVTPTIALNFKVALNHEVVNLYSEKIMWLSEKIKSLCKENATLQQLRDTLLPKLLSGEIEINDDLEV
ncbi:restriction endonuclease subunit S [Bacillus safensis]|uniref:restriction endonuclease subunit S n=1 Tax=Bacillus safensis TaxID=561879 RepID=UPI0022829035|nr:restriction endonuclease subunit S [Bacillus safensis]MCY7735643.1 restriction endonuclease subunit S [Bacillus safensis]